jgi:molecular chaperone DnaK
VIEIKKKIIGIDLGTTNSVVAVLEGANPMIIKNHEGSGFTPSYVAFLKSGECIIGQNAKRQSIVNPENTFYSVKRFIGSNFDDIKNEAKLVSYQVHSSENGKVKIKCPVLQKEFSPEEISAFVLKKLAEDAQRYLKTTIKDAVITVPAYFNDSQRQATKDAGIIAGLNVVRILNEPTAAALAYGLNGLNKKKNQIILIYDIGGGTVDVTLLELGDDVFEVLATSGDTHLGGDDFDQVIANFLINDFKKSYGIDLFTQKQALQRIIEASEKAKIELSTLSSTKISIPFITIKSQVALHIDIEYTKTQFEEDSKFLVQRCKEPLLKVLSDAKLTHLDIDDVILVGGSSRIPIIRDFLLEIMKKPLHEKVNPDEVVALGSAVQAGILAGEITDLVLLDVTPLTLGVETFGGVMAPIITRNSPIPIKQAQIFSTGFNNQESVTIHVLQGERPLAKHNKSLGLFRLSGIPLAARGIPKIKVTFNIDVNGLLSVTAREQKSRVEQSITIKNSSVLDREEVDRMVIEAQQNSSKDNLKVFLRVLILYLDRFYNKYEKTSKILNNSRILYNFMIKLILFIIKNKHLHSLYIFNQ